MQPCNLATLQPCNIQGHKTQCSHYDSYGIYYDVTLLTVSLFYSMFLSDFVQHCTFFQLALMFCCCIVPISLIFWHFIVGFFYLSSDFVQLVLVHYLSYAVLVLPPDTVGKPRQRFSTGKQRGEDNIPTERDENRPESEGGKQYSHGTGRKQTGKGRGQTIFPREGTKRNSKL